MQTFSAALLCGCAPCGPGLSRDGEGVGTELMCESLTGGGHERKRDAAGVHEQSRARLFGQRGQGHECDCLGCSETGFIAGFVLLCVDAYRAQTGWRCNYLL